MSLAFEYIIFALDARALLLYNYDKRSRIFSHILLKRNQSTFLVQFGINKHGLVQFCRPLKKFTRAYLFQIVLEIM